MWRMDVQRGVLRLRVPGVTMREIARHEGWSLWRTEDGWELRQDGRTWMRFDDREEALDDWWVISGMRLSVEVAP